MDILAGTEPCTPDRIRGSTPSAVFFSQTIIHYAHVEVALELVVNDDHLVKAIMPVLMGRRPLTDPLHGRAIGLKIQRALLEIGWKVMSKAQPGAVVDSPHVTTDMQEEIGHRLHSVLRKQAEAFAEAEEDTNEGGLVTYVFVHQYRPNHVLLRDALHCAVCSVDPGTPLRCMPYGYGRCIASHTSFVQVRIAETPRERFTAWVYWWYRMETMVRQGLYMAFRERTTNFPFQDGLEDVEALLMKLACFACDAFELPMNGTTSGEQLKKIPMPHNVCIRREGEHLLLYGMTDDWASRKAREIQRLHRQITMHLRPLFAKTMWSVRRVKVEKDPFIAQTVMEFFDTWMKLEVPALANFFVTGMTTTTSTPST